MSNLKPIKWFEYESVIDISFDAATPICEYDVWKSHDCTGWVVEYYNRQTEEPTKIATGFSSPEDAKEWAWQHYNEKMQLYLEPVPVWIDAKVRLPVVTCDTQFICAYDSAIEPFVKITHFDKALNEFGYEHGSVLAWMPVPSVPNFGG